MVMLPMNFNQSPKNKMLKTTKLVVVRGIEHIAIVLILLNISVILYFMTEGNLRG